MTTAPRLAREIGDFVAGHSVPPVAAADLEQSRAALLDCIGVALLGRHERVASTIQREVTEDARGTATVWGSAAKASWTGAVLANAVAAHALDYDPILRGAFAQPAAVLVPAIVGLAERIGTGPGRVVRANALGMRVLATLGAACGRDLHAAGWHPTSLLGAVAAAAAASYLMDLDVRRTERAVGITASLASGVRRNFGTTAKAIQVGEAARRGAWAAWLADDGVTADPSSLDVWLALLLGRDAAPPLDWSAGSVHVDVKKYPCCGRMHAALDACLELRNGVASVPHGGSVECRLNPVDIPHIDRPVVRTADEAKFSIQFCVGAALMRGHVALSDFEAVEPLPVDVGAVMPAVRVVPDAGVPSFGADVRLLVPGGEDRRLRLEAPVAPTDAERVRKFVDCCVAAGASEQSATRLAGAVNGLGEGVCLNDVLDLMPVLD